MKTVAVLDSQGCFTGTEEVPDDEVAERILVPSKIDLPCDGSYRWDTITASFVPLGRSGIKPVNSPVPADYAIFLALKALLDGAPIPEDVRAYVDWYDQNLRQRAQERVLVQRHRGGSRR